MEQRICPVCRRSFTPASANARFCPPTDEERARIKPGNPAVSYCGKAYQNAKQRGRLDTLLAEPRSPPEPFDCARCLKPCVPGLNVAPHASRFCGERCKISWHSHYVEGHTLGPVADVVLIGRDHAAIAAWRERCALQSLEEVFGPSLRRDELAYRRALRRDPCAYCGRTAEALDHIDPRAQGGADGWHNRTAACHSCNSLKGKLALLEALPWIPVATEYHAMRRALYAA